MNSPLIFILKVLALSGAISLFIKYLAPLWSIPANTLDALIAIAFPPLLLALLLWKRRLSP
ncbi:hypothetical protein K4A83_16095 [Spirulina subsalsa FACHB-351]|uniref:Uncharacterized protein n=1 Tax=Spirulina subsalsa FACHB-351 TaxID=234711 RepID=A0ABT3L9Y2_9CYAN|nr:hypothetical protein [Spirulina subsalsa]MCW6037780.1 hypothetical protein [Spirulina subsalsa FACHB-351]